MEIPRFHHEIEDWVKPLNTGNPLDEIYYCQSEVCNNRVKISLSNMGVVAAKKDTQSKQHSSSQSSSTNAQCSAQVAPPSVSTQATSSFVSSTSNKTHQ